MKIPEVRKSKKRNIKLSEMTDILEGRQTSVFKRFKLRKNELFKEAHSFSIVAKGRTLGLEASAEVEVRLFIGYLRVVLATQKIMD